jgi:hypothetical protein
MALLGRVRPSTKTIADDRLCIRSHACTELRQDGIGQAADGMIASANRRLTRSAPQKANREGERQRQR